MREYRKGLPGWREFQSFFMRFSVSLGDMVCVSLAYLTAYYLRFYVDSLLHFFPVTKGFPSVFEYIKAGPLILFMWGLSLGLCGMYGRINYPALDEFLRVVKASLLGAFLSMSVMFLYRESSFSRLVFVMGGGIAGLYVYLFRELLKGGYLYWIRRNKKPHRVLLLGNGYLSKSLKRILEKSGDRAVLNLHNQDIEKVQRAISRSRISEVLVANANLDHVQSIALANFCEEKKVKFRLLPDILELRMGEVLIDESLGIPTFHLKPVSLHGTAFLTKRFMDVVLATLVMGFSFVPLVIVAAVIKLSSKGPIFYSHKRMGYKMVAFEFLKFRTMVQEADNLLESLKQQSDRSGPVFKMKKDPRVTPFGQILRRFSLDEIPQFLNVLRGEMSLVGPRPQVLWEAQSYDDWAKKRLNVLPGITGLWQVSGRAELTFEEMIELDIFYIEHWSPGLDIKIMLRTLPAVLTGRGAY